MKIDNSIIHHHQGSLGSPSCRRRTPSAHAGWYTASPHYCPQPRWPLPSNVPRTQHFTGISYPLGQEAFSRFHFLSNANASLIIHLYSTDKAHSLKSGCYYTTWPLNVNRWEDFVWTSVDKDNRTWATGRLGFRTKHVKIVINMRKGRVNPI